MWIVGPIATAVYPSFPLIWPLRSSAIELGLIEPEVVAALVYVVATPFAVSVTVKVVLWLAILTTTSASGSRVGLVAVFSSTVFFVLMINV